MRASMHRTLDADTFTRARVYLTEKQHASGERKTDFVEVLELCISVGLDLKTLIQRLGRYQTKS